MPLDPPVSRTRFFMPSSFHRWNEQVGLELLAVEERREILEGRRHHPAVRKLARSQLRSELLVEIQEDFAELRAFALNRLLDRRFQLGRCMDAAERDAESGRDLAEVGK